jgi:predicted DNA-binding antitoxin AbrB/MazE fold protein
MKRKIDAIYENGLLRPLEPLDLADQQQVSLTVESGVRNNWVDQEAVQYATAEGDASIPLEDVRGRLAQLSGSLAELVTAERGEY